MVWEEARVWTRWSSPCAMRCTRSWRSDAAGWLRGWKTSPLATTLRGCRSWKRAAPDAGLGGRTTVATLQWEASTSLSGVDFDALLSIYLQCYKHHIRKNAHRHKDAGAVAIRPAPARRRVDSEHRSLCPFACRTCSCATLSNTWLTYERREWPGRCRASSSSQV